MRPWIVIAALALAGCANKEDGWVRVDNSPPAQDQLEAAMSSCRGEANKTNALERRVNLYDRQEMFNDCMAGRGWKLQRD